MIRKPDDSHAIANPPPDTDELRRRIADRASRSSQSVADVAHLIDEPGSRVGGSLCALLDCSDSMAGEDKLSSAKSGLIDMAREVARALMRVGLVRFSSAATIEVPVCRFDSTMVERVQGLQCGGSTNMAAGLKAAIETLGRAMGRKVILLVTDGMPDDANAALAEGDRARRLGIEVWTIGTTDADNDFLRRIAWSPATSQVARAPDLARAINHSATLLLTGGR